MKYFIGHLIESDVALWHSNLSKEISGKFDVFKVSEWVPFSNVTLFRFTDNEKWIVEKTF